MHFQVRYKKHTTQIKYGLVVVGVFFMIYLIRALVNYQTIIDSTNQVVKEMQQTKNHTDFINNFLHPYLESDYAPFFLAHENNQLFPGERIININYREEVAALEQWEDPSAHSTSSSWDLSSSTTPQQERIRYLKEIYRSSWAK